MAGEQVPPETAGPRVLHLAHSDEWVQAQRTGTFDRSTRGLTLADVGFIHTSGSDQVAQVANSYYADDPEPLLLLVIDVAATESAGSRLVWEDGGAGQEFPHFYGPIPAEAIVAALPVRFDPVAGFVTPDLSGLRVVSAAER